jgi:hypothetical protein
MAHFIITLANDIEYYWFVETAVVAVGIVYAINLWARGVFPALLRLGNGLARRKIALFAKGDNVSSLRHLLMDSGLFKERNICEITKKEDIGRAQGATLYLVFWSDCAPYIEEILQQKPDACALIVYAPYNQGRIPEAQMNLLDGKRHTAVTNFRGRLLNDIIGSLITTSYEQK